MKENIKSTAIKGVLSYLDSNPDENIPKLINAVEMFDRDRNFAGQIRAVRESFEDKSGNWHVLFESLYTDLDGGVRKKMFENFVINSAVIGMNRQNEAKEKNGCNVPWAILIDPTSACNLHCKGCWAAEYEKNLNLPISLWDSVIWQGKAHGTFVYLYSGGEPLVRKYDIIRICEEHSDCIFAAFTNATLIDEAFADELLRVKNFVPIISVEGFQEETDFRRGEGVYASAVKAMELLKRKKLLFGVSCCYTSKNTETIGSEEYFDDLISKGAKFAWFFTYMPVGVHADPDLMATAGQREFMYRQIRSFRQTKPLFTIDFWNDGEYVQGCIAGGKCYLHINANGDIEPCAFIHYSDSNIKEKTLLEAYKSPLFMQYHDNQPFNGNHLRPCPLLDNPGRLTEMVKKSGAVSTDLQNPEDAAALSGKCEHAAEQWAGAADRLWRESREYPDESITYTGENTAFTEKRGFK
jgi:MoaA/NifB/PqqE/SkfB family radical SAM enzyme